MKTKFFRKNASVKAGAHVSRFLGKLGMTVVLLSPVVLSAQNGVTVTGLAVEAGTVTFNVSWDKNSDELKSIVWFDSVWVFVDYNAGGVMKRLPLAQGATLTATSAPGSATVIQYDGNEKGVWVVGNARNSSAGSFSATVKLLTATADIAGACVYASNYPPVAEYNISVDNVSISFTGTPPYDLVVNTGSGTVSAQAYSTYNLFAGQTLVSFTDKTGAPGIIKCIPPATHTLIASATGFCVDDAAGVTFALQSTQSGVKYQLYRDGTTAAVGVLDGTGSAGTFTGGPFKDAGVYTAKSEADGVHCAVAMTGSRAVTKNAKPTAPTVSQPANVCLNGGNIVFTASDYSGSLTWMSYTGGMQSGNSVTFASAATGPKSVKAQSSQTYSGASTCVSAEVSKSATVNALPTVPNINVSPATVCQNGGNIVFTASGYSGSLTWMSYTGGTPSGSSVTFASAATGTKSVTARSAQTYTNAATCYSAEVSKSVTVNKCCDAPGTTVDFTAFAPCPNAAPGSTWSLADTREVLASPSNPQTYTVKLMGEGHYWMVQDMKFGNKCSENTFNSITGNTTGRVSTLSGTWYGNCTNAKDDNIPAARGYLYDWAAAIQRAGAYKGGSEVGCSGTVTGTGTSPEACQGICPSGWHIPTGGAAGEFNVLYGTLNTCSNWGCWAGDKGGTVFAGVLGGGCTDTGLLHAQGTYGFYASSTSGSTAGACILYYSVGTNYPGTFYDNNTKSFGHLVRCVRNY